MTMFMCHCGKIHDSAVQGYCPVIVELVAQPLTPEQAGREIRRLLMSLYAPGHTAEDERAGRLNYATDELRMQALDRAGICWLKPGEMAPACCCPWTPEKPEGPRLRLEEDQAEAKALWNDECVLRDFRNVTCSKGIEHCVVKHRVRELELTEEDREALEMVRAEVDEFGLAADDPEPGYPSHGDGRHRRRALALLDRLVKGGR